MLIELISAESCFNNTNINMHLPDNLVPVSSLLVNRGLRYRRAKFALERALFRNLIDMEIGMEKFIIVIPDLTQLCSM